MKCFTLLFAMIGLLAMAWPATAQRGYETYEDYDAGYAPQLVQDRYQSNPPRRTIYARPLTTRYVNTSATRAVDARRAAESGVIHRQPTRAYVVTNPAGSYEPTRRSSSSVPRAYQPPEEREAKGRSSDTSAVPSTYVPNASADTTPLPAEAQPAVNVIVAPPALAPPPVEVARFVNTRPDPVTSQVGTVRPSPPISRIDNPVQPANHRYIAPNRPGVTYVTRDRSYPSYTPSSGRYQPSTVAIIDRDPQPRYIYPNYFYDGYRGTSYGYDGYNDYYRRGYGLDLNFNDPNDK